MNTYDEFKGEDLKIAELIQQRRLQVLVHSCIYYEMNSSVISDKQFDEWAKELVKLQKEYPEISEKVCYAKEFKGFDGSTGFYLPLDDEWVTSKAKKILMLSGNVGKAIRVPKNKPLEVKTDKKGKFKLF